MNKKGFTIIELAVSFVLVATISLTLLQLVLSLKEVYLSGEVKTTLLNKQGIMTKKIYDDLSNRDIRSINRCGLSCIMFEYADSSQKKLLVDPGNKTVTYGDYTIQLTDASYFGDLSFNLFPPTEVRYESTIADDSILKIDIPIYSKLIDNEDFGFHIVKTYNHSLPVDLTIDLNSDSDISNTVVTLNGIDTKMTVLFDTDDNDNIDKTKLLGIFVNIYHQDKSDITDSIYRFEKFIKEEDKSETSNRFSNLASLEAFRTTINNEQIISKEIERIESLEGNNDTTSLREDYHNGYFSLLLNYNNADLNSGNYAWWYQPTNFAKKEVSRNSVINSYKKGTFIDGLSYVENDNFWANNAGRQANLGVKTGGKIIDLNGEEAQSVDLYVEAREYICKYNLGEFKYGLDDIKDIELADGTKFCPTNE